MNPYETCPVFENENYLLRLIEPEDASDLFLVYSDTKTVSLCNADNCSNTFYCTSRGQVQQMIDFWLDEYRKKYYVRWAIRDKNTCRAIGTIEFFNRQAEDYFTDCGLLRLDLHSDYETPENITEILSLLLRPAFDLFRCRMIATKVPGFAAERKNAVESLGFALSEEVLVGSHNGTAYGDYFVLHK